MKSLSVSALYTFEWSESEQTWIGYDALGEEILYIQAPSIGKP